MSSNKGIEQLKELQKKLEKFEQSKVEEFYAGLAREVALRFLSYVIPDTPVETGRLRRGWIGLDSEGQTPSDAEQRSYVNSTHVKTSKSRASITINNNVVYAPYVNFGHRLKRGKKSAWVSGQFMLERATKNTEKVLKSTAERYAKKFFGENF